MSNSEIPLCGVKMLAGEDWLCDLAKGHEYAHYSSVQDLGAAPEWLVKGLCGEERDGAICKREKDHDGLHCSIPELIEMRPEEFAQMSREMELKVVKV